MSESDAIGKFLKLKTEGQNNFDSILKTASGIAAVRDDYATTYAMMAMMIDAMGNGIIAQNNAGNKFAEMAEEHSLDIDGLKNAAISTPAAKALIQELHSLWEMQASDRKVINEALAARVNRPEPQNLTQEISAVMEDYETSMMYRYYSLMDFRYLVLAEHLCSLLIESANHPSAVAESLIQKLNNRTPDHEDDIENEIDKLWKRVSLLNLPDPPEGLQLFWKGIIVAHTYDRSGVTQERFCEDIKKYIPSLELLDRRTLLRYRKWLGKIREIAELSVMPENPKFPKNSPPGIL